MVNRKKRLEKGIQSIEEQIKIHEEKMKTTQEEGNLELEGYYEKEINKFKNEIQKKSKQLDKS